MARSIALYRIFVASTGDLSAERVAVREAIAEVNRTLRTSEIVLELVEGWVDAIPDVGAYAQAVINEQLLDDIDIFVCLMGIRVGTPTPQAESGTIEEWKVALRLRASSAQEIRMMLYFKDAPIRPSELDLMELDRVRNFQKMASAEGALYAKFESPDELARLLRLHLHQVCLSLSRYRPTPAAAIVEQSKQPEMGQPRVSEIAVELDDDDEQGLFEYVEQAEEGLAEITAILGRVNSAISDVGSQLIERTSEIQDKGPDISTKEKRVIVDRAAENIQSFVSRISGDVDEFGRLVFGSLDSFIKALDMQRQMSASSESEEENEQYLRSKDELIKVVGLLFSSIDAPLKALDGLLIAIASSGRFTKNFNKSKRMALFTLNKYKDSIIVMKNLLENLLRTLQSNDSFFGELFS